MTEVQGAPRILSIIVGLVVAGFGVYAIGWLEGDRIPWWGAMILCMVGLALCFPNQMLLIWGATKDKLPSWGGRSNEG